MKKRILALFLAVCTLMSFAAVGASADAEINSLPDYETLVDAQPAIKLNDAPEDSTDVSYGWLNNIPAIDQIDFTYDGHTYCFRAAAWPVGTASLDISGVSEQFSAISTVEVSDENQAGGSYNLRYDSQSGKGLANWTSEMAETQYSLYSADACKGDKIEDMPFVEVMEMLYIYDQDAKTVSGTVVGVTDNTLALNLTDGSSAAVNCEHIKNITVKSGDAVDVFYLGEIDGDTEVVRIVPTDGDESSPASNTFSGNILSYVDDLIYVLTNDENVFPFEITSSTVVSGAASKLAENEDVIITFDGDLYSVPYVPPVAKEVNVTFVGATPKPEPSPTPSPAYTDRYIEGYVTSVGGIYVTVNGIVFTVNGANCYLTGKPTVGCYAGISYRDFGNGYYVVLAASFSSSPVPTPTPEYHVSGAAYNYTGDSVSILISSSRGQLFYINSRTRISGHYAEGCYAEVTYTDSYVATYIVFYAPTPTPTPTPAPERYATGNAYNYTGSSVDIGGQRFSITGRTAISGHFAEGCYTEITYASDTLEALYIVFYAPAPTPTPAPPIVGPAGAGWTCENCGMRNGVYDAFCSRCGTPRDGGSSGWSCSNCGTPNGEYDVYCSSCGISRSGTGHISDVQ